MRMQTNQQWDYIAPEIEMQVIKVEQGFSISNPNSEPMPEIGEEKDEIGW
jgi:hypothetical protein